MWYCSARNAVKSKQIRAYVRHDAYQRWCHHHSLGHLDKYMKNYKWREFSQNTWFLLLPKNNVLVIHLHSALKSNSKSKGPVKPGSTSSFRWECDAGQRAVGCSHTSEQTLKKSWSQLLPFLVWSGTVTYKWMRGERGEGGLPITNPLCFLFFCAIWITSDDDLILSISDPSSISSYFFSFSQKMLESRPEDALVKLV